ncbi:MAG TPA: glycoside hydrolase family 30 beta sandwich domain-containing protein [Polyangiaceae bacterium]|nr:glycoside hydrolase family 30 beta sandwich domain-containing protein [Polyangiaceae bacterium]
MIALLATAGTACSSGRSESSAGTGGAHPSGGANIGGATSSGGAPASGGAPGTSGAPGIGGGTSSGGAPGTGGTTGSSGASSGGGAPSSSGGSASGGAMGRGGAGGAVGSGGAGGSVINPTACSTGTAQSSDVTVSLSSLQQKISGFGISSAWAGSFANASDPDYLWSTTKGAGLTLLRIRYGDGLTIAKSAAQNGVTVWMTVWGTGTNGAPGGANTTSQNNPNGCTNGASPVLTNLQAEADTIAAWITNAKSQGVPIYALSPANEPDSCGINQTSSYSPAQLASWIDTLAPVMANIGVKIMAPETQNGYGFPSYFSAIQKDTTAWNAVSIFASHEYGLAPPVQPAIAAAGKEYWQTEVDVGTASSDASGDGIASALLMAKAIHTDLTKDNLNAWLLWWLYNSGKNGGCLYNTGSKVWTKRLWVMGNYSRFVRPGYMRVSTSGSVPAGVLLTAYKNPADGTVVVVAVNNNTAATPVSLYISGVVPCSITPWVTSATDNLATKSPITVSNARFSATLDAQSVTTFVGTP